MYYSFFYLHLVFNTPINIFNKKASKMKKLILIVTLFAATAVNAQTAKELIGKWKLINWTVGGEARDIKKTMKTDEVYQVFKEDGKFESLVGGKVSNGTWKLSGDNKTLTVEAAGGVNKFSVDSFDEKTRTITSAAIGTLTYQKQR